MIWREGAGAALAARRARRLVWPLAIAGATVVATVVVLALGVLVYRDVPDGPAVAAVATGMVVGIGIGTVTANALRHAIRNAIPALRRAPAEVSRRIADAAALPLPVDELLQRAAEAIATSLDSTRVEIWLAQAREPQLLRSGSVGAALDAVSFRAKDVAVAARIGVANEGWTQRWLPQLLPPGTDRRAPLRVGAVTDAGELLGLVVAGRAAGSPSYERAEQEALAAACRQLAVVLRNRGLTRALEASLADLRRSNAELQASRARIVSAADAERRRIERDLHDGAQQHLLALAVDVALLRQMLADGEDVDAFVDQLSQDVRGAVQQIRELAHGIYPALLMDAGLEPALRSVAARSPLPTTVRTENLMRQPPEVEAALYFCCLEALQNAAKHASEASVVIDVVEHGGVLTATVTDDGPGFDPSVPTAGLGRTTMADRVGALGGTVRWKSAPGRGTAVVIEVPVSAAG